MEEVKKEPSASPPLTPAPPPFIGKTVAELKDYARQQNLYSKMDLPTLQSVAAVISQHGFSHFELSKDTKLTMEARKSHRFVAMNCEDLARNTLRLSGQDYDACEKMLHAIALEALKFKEQKMMKARKPT